MFLIFFFNFQLKPLMMSVAFAALTRIATIAVTFAAFDFVCCHFCATDSDWLRSNRQLLLLDQSLVQLKLSVDINVGCEIGASILVPTLLRVRNLQGRVWLAAAA